MKKDFHLDVEQLDQKILLSSNPWYIDAIKASEVWGESASTISKPVVAIVDSGIDLNHSALIPNLFKNPLDPVDGKDNDNNGCIDDISGWDFVDNDNSPQDGFYHGTHVAGIINAIGNNNISILPLRFMNNNGSGYTGAAANAIHYVVDLKLKGINIAAINCSFGGVLSNSNVLSSAIQKASDNGIVVVIAAGNDGSDLDVTPRYPGSLNYANTITVAATNSDNTLAGYSNYGVKSVSIAAPGTGIYSTLPGGTYGSVSGTSMSAPMVSGAIGLLQSFGRYSSTVILDVLKKGASMVGNLADKVGSGLLNISASFGILKTLPVQPIVAPPPPPVVVAPKLMYNISVSGRSISGWANLNTGTSKPVVKVYVNNVLKYSVAANIYRTDTRKNNGFSVTVERRFLNLRSNMVVVKIVDNANGLNETVYRGYMKR